MFTGPNLCNDIYVDVGTGRIDYRPKLLCVTWLYQWCYELKVIYKFMTFMLCSLVQSGVGESLPQYV